MRIRHHFSRVCATDADEMPYMTSFCFLSLLSSLSIHKTCLLKQRLPAICHPNTSTEATGPPIPDTTQADESLSLNKAYHQSGEIRGFSWAGKRKCVSTERGLPMVLTHSARGGLPPQIPCPKTWSLLSIIIPAMKFNLSSTHGQTN